MAYAGFGNRLLAYLLDGLIVTVAESLFVGLVAVIVVFGVGMSAVDPSNVIFLLFAAIIAIVVTLGPLASETVMISQQGATYGKAFRKAKVVRTNGDAVSWQRALSRTLPKVFLSGFLLVGFLMALFTAKKQTLHDLIADTLVIQLN